MQLCALPALADNYIWVLHNGREAIVCDPAEAEVVISALQRWQLALAAILITHHHDDHIGGVNELYRQCGTPATQVYLPAADGLSPQAFPAISPQALRPCRQGDSVQLVGFGTFKSSKRAARTGKNPATGAAIKIPATTVPKFVAGAKFKAVVDPKAAKRKAAK